ncbi:hypothetical protein T07_7337 [Trichinella nelsoni]|uniref:Uncharacterized protein n=1 Tax=Trichinella nelsoni TaxID=6336 RepID=A0A0V0SMW1_9BILA|nr:hypothetical protein T07_7337 [Trichinella nelsoni]
MFAYGKFLPLRLYIYIVYTNLFLRVMHKYTLQNQLSDLYTYCAILPRFCSRLNLLCCEIFGAKALD